MPTKTPGKCMVCGAVGLLTTGRCNACYKWLRKTGQERPRERFTKYCMDCHVESARMVKGTCPRCYSYRLRHGKKRPVWLHEKFECRGCGIMLTRGVNETRHGLCAGCYRGRERDPGRKKIMRCDCGKKATLKVEVTVGSAIQDGGKKQTLRLCDDCHKLFLEIEGLPG